MTQAELEASYSKDNNLKGLTVKVGEESYSIDPVFDKNTLEYKVTVPTGTTSVHVEALKMILLLQFMEMEILRLQKGLILFL